MVDKDMHPIIPVGSFPTWIPFKPYYVGIKNSHCIENQCWLWTGLTREI